MMLRHRFLAMALAAVIMAGCAADPRMSKRRFKKYPLASGRAETRTAKLDAIPSPVTGAIKISAPYKVNGVTYYPLATADGYTQTGTASWYGPDFHGKKTGNGEIYDQMDRTAAHLTLPFNIMVRVENLENGKSTVVRVNDRGPFAKNRIIDLSRQAAIDIGMIRKGTARVRLTALPRSAADAVNTTVTDAGYFVQAGAFSSQDKAEAIKIQIPRKYAPIARIMPKTGSDGTLHRLIVGPFPDRAKAAKAARQINTFARTPTRIIRQP